MLTLHASHTPARLPVSPSVPARPPLAEPPIKHLREQKSAGPEVASLLKPAARPQPRPSEHWVPARPGLAARVRASLYPLAAGWRERQTDSMRAYLRLASQRRSPGLDAVFAEQRAFWQAHPADQIRSLRDPYRRLLANHGLALPAVASGETALIAASRGAGRTDVQTLERLLGFFTEEQHAVECLANELAKTELASTAGRWALALDEIRAGIKAEYVERVSQSPGAHSPGAVPSRAAPPSLLAPTIVMGVTSAAPSDAAFVAGSRLEVVRVRPTDHAQSLG